MGKREAIDQTAHISIIAGMINPTDVRFSKSENAILPHSLIFSKGYTITDGGQLGSAYLDVVVPLETIITDNEYGERMAGNAIKVRLRAYWKPLYRFKPEIPLCRTHIYHTVDGLYAGIQYMLRTIKAPVHYTILDGVDRSWGFNWKNTHILCEDLRPRREVDCYNTLCLMSNSFFEDTINLTAEPVRSYTVGSDGDDIQIADQVDHLGVFEGISKALDDRADTGAAAEGLKRTVRPVCDKHNRVMTAGTFSVIREYREIHKKVDGCRYFCQACADEIVKQMWAAIGPDAEAKKVVVW